ncbi:uncharacterized protein LOC115627277 [Scaptodrosophila lebanonensis]|uniref:Uncharacterized protein LOC115627277 n=1 Tax=Drosophila lebanonensis TaxID=7225 RepID=A0A6J2TV40_DROLE|nr:uncharacterized protein LOC115627277 [Scaptodrosophila lebanonensis]
MLETKSIAALAETITTPVRKRKRETLPQPPLAVVGKDSEGNNNVAAAVASCFTNAAFSSTPKKLVARRRLSKENTNPFLPQSACLEVKSIADLQAEEQQQQQPQISTNPFEVVRQPQKKKKREHACFENQGLNLDLPEKQFNPYEVIRTTNTPSKCFVNQALNVRGNDAPASLNPFEIHRPSEASVAACNRAGVENPALAEDPLPTNLKIGLPFAPNLGCRIDFKGLSLAQLTPSKLLAEKLVFSPVMAPNRSSLGAISEETTMDIGKELDRYQLELENSINEAKLRKNGVVLETESQDVLVVEEKQQLETAQEHIELERRTICIRRRTLTEISEVPEELEESLPEEKPQEPAAALEVQPAKEEEPVDTETEENTDVAYASDSEEEELEFKAPTRFVRAYRPAAASIEQLRTVSKESLHSVGSSQSTKSGETRASRAVGHIIRKSLRRLMHPMQQHPHPVEEQHKSSPEKHSHNIMSSIRHSLRRRTHKSAVATEESKPADISIIDVSERTMKLRSNLPETEYMPIEHLTNEKKHTLRNSIRHSTRALRHVFHKSQDYATAK